MRLAHFLLSDILVIGTFIQHPSVKSAVHYSLWGQVPVDDNGTVTHYMASELNQYPRVSDFSPSYNANGNLVGMGDWLYQHDALGSVTILTDKDGHLAERYTYSVTGEVRVYDSNGVKLTNSAFGNCWMFTGREWLPEIGLYDYRNRVYSATLGRFLQTDPVKFHATDLNLYRYINNNYLNLIDPYGEETYGFRINGTATWFFGVDISIAVVWDDKGGFDVMIGMGPALVLPTPQASVTAGWTFTNAETVKDLQGWGFSVGATALAGMQ